VSQLADSLSGQFDRLPPSAVDAEMCLLASMMLDKDMIARSCRSSIARLSIRPTTRSFSTSS